MLEGLELFSSLSKEDINTLELFCQQRVISAGEVLFEKGDESTSMYIVVSGLLEVYDEEKVLGVINPGEIVGEMSLFGEVKSRMASVKVIEDAEIIVLLGFSINELGKKHPEILDKIKEIIQNREVKNKLN